MPHALIRSIRNWCRSVGEAWTTFWFRPTDPTLLGLIRILAGSMLLYTHAVWSLDLESFFGPHGWMSAEAVRTLQQNQLALSYWWWVPPDKIWWAHGAALLVLALFTAGWMTRVTSILAFIITVSYVHRVPSALFGLDQINGMLALYLAIGPSGAALSVDRWLSRRSASRKTADGELPAWRPAPSSGANLSLRLIQVHMCVIYFFAGITKLQGPAWWTGEAMWMAFANLEYQTYDMIWLADYPRLVDLMTHTVVTWEITFAALIWIRLLRPLVLAGAVALHVGIGVCMGMWTFGLVMLIGCTAFLPPALGKAPADS
jgi:hypothetical protein